MPIPWHERIMLLLRGVHPETADRASVRVNYARFERVTLSVACSDASQHFVPGTGIEPVRRNLHRILSPVRLPSSATLARNYDNNCLRVSAYPDS